MANTKISGATLRAPQSTDKIPTARDADEAPYYSTAQAIADLASGGGLPLQLPIVDGRYYFSPIGCHSNGVGPLLEDNPDIMRAIPIFFGETKTWTRIGINSAGGGASGVARVGIYSALASGFPDQLLAGGAELTVSNLGGAVEETISQALTANTIYWLAFLCDAAEVGVTGFSNNSAGGTPSSFSTQFFGFGSEVWNTPNLINGIYKAQAYGSLPSSFGTPDGYLTSEMEHIWLRTGV